MLRRIVVPAALLAITASACGGINKKQANELSADERTEVCEDLRDYADSKITEDDGKKFACVFAGETAAALDMSVTCEEARDMCLAEPAEPTTDDSDDCALAEETDCTATVEEIKDCSEAQVDQYAAFIKSFDCGAADAAAPDEIPAECEPVKEKCPDWF